MREIKFRGIDADTAEWHYGDIVHHDGIVSHICQHPADGSMRVMQLNPETIGQYTGLKDYNSKEVYEGDIIKVEDWGAEYYVVEYFGEYDYPAFDLVPDVVDDCNGLSHLMAMTRFEVVGNRWDNPELLEEAAHE